MTKQRKTLPARRKTAADSSLLLRSAESLGRMIGSLQRQLEAARQLTIRAADTEVRGNGHASARKRAADGETGAKARSRTKRRTVRSSRSKK